MYSLFSTFLYPGIRKTAQSQYFDLEHNDNATNHSETCAYLKIDWLGMEMDSVLHDILRDRLGKYLSGHEQSRYDDKYGLANSVRYWQL